MFPGMAPYTHFVIITQRCYRGKYKFGQPASHMQVNRPAAESGQPAVVPGKRALYRIEWDINPAIQ